MAIDIIARGMIESSKSDISQLFDITKGGEIVNNESSYTLNNTVDYPLLGLNLYGKSTQDGTPTPENPVEIVSVGDSGFDIISKGDTHFNLLSVRDNGSEIITKQPVSAAVKIGVTAPFSVTATGTGLKYQWQILTKGSTTWKNSGSAGNTTDTLIASIDDNWRGAKVRCIVTDANGNREISNEAAIYVVSNDYEAKTSSIATDVLPLCGIPVDSGGNYTDSNGQQWICDELIYNADGTGKITKNIEKIIFDGSVDENWINPYTKTEFTNDFKIQYSKLNGTKAESIPSNFTMLYCNRLQYNNSVWNNDVCGCQIASIGDFIVRMPSSIIGGNGVVAFRSWLANNPLTVVYQIVPQEIELTSAEVDALRTLQTFDGVTNISNSAGAEMSVKYCTNKALSEYVLPIFNGLQAQIDELRAAVLSLGGNV